VTVIQSFIPINIFYTEGHDDGIMLESLICHVLNPHTYEIQKHFVYSEGYPKYTGWFRKKGKYFGKW
jgi:hypothetical protein